MPQDIMNEVFLERAVRDLGRIETEAANAGGNLSVLACLVDMALDEAREQLGFIKNGSRKNPAATELAGTFLR